MDNQIITSILDTDLYKITMQNFILEMYPSVKAKYCFINRSPESQKFTPSFLDMLKEQIDAMKEVSLTDDEKDFLISSCPYLHRGYLEFLKNYKFDPSEVETNLEEDNLVIEINGNWCKTVLWEVPLMAIISEIYFETIDKRWTRSGQYKLASKKTELLSKEKCFYADFSTRRRRSKQIQKNVLSAFFDYKNLYSKNNKDSVPSTFIGTSNVFFAKEFGLKPIGTYAHEIPQAMQALEGIRNSNYYAMDNWSRVFKANLGIALTDTITTDQFLKNFNLRFSKLFDGVRQDSGDEFMFAEKMVKHYESMGIDSLSKTIVFSNGLNVDKAIEINKFCKGKIKCSFGIGTNFSNDFKNSPALNMVIKLFKINNTPVIKLSDEKGKESGDPKALELTKWIINN